MAAKIHEMKIYYHLLNKLEIEFEMCGWIISQRKRSDLVSDIEIGQSS